MSNHTLPLMCEGCGGAYKHHELYWLGRLIGIFTQHQSESKATIQLSMVTETCRLDNHDNRLQRDLIRCECVTERHITITDLDPTTPDCAKLPQTQPTPPDHSNSTSVLPTSLSNRVSDLPPQPFCSYMVYHDLQTLFVT